MTMESGGTRVTFTVEAPSIKRASRAALVMLERALEGADIFAISLEPAAD